MMKAVQNGEIDTVVVFAFSRFARSVTYAEGPGGYEKPQDEFRVLD